MKLARIIIRRVEKTISAAVDLDQHRVTNQKYIFSELFGFPYPQAARYCIGKIVQWAEKYSIPREEIAFFFENGAKHKGQIKWIAGRDGLPEPEFLNKARTPLQAGDLLAWSHNLFLTTGAVPDIYRRALDELSRSPNDWELIDMRDPDRIPTILEIPLRDPTYEYKHMIVRHNGVYRPVVRYWQKSQGEPKIERRTLVLPERKRLSFDEARRISLEYDSRRKGSVQ